MMILKVLLQVFTMIGTSLIAVLDYLWRDKRTSKFKKGRLWLYITLLILFPISITVTILDEQEKKREIEGRDSKIAELTSKLENITNELTGGDSFCYFVHQTHMYMSSSEPRSYNDIELWLMHSGKYPLSDIYIKLVDSQKFNQLLSELPKLSITYEQFNAAMDKYFHIPKLNPQHQIFVVKFDLPADVNKYDFNVTFDVRNGRWVQELRFLRTKTNEKWGLASRTRRGDKVLQEQGGESLPKDDSGKPKWN
jgi:hypothetical protein